MINKLVLITLSLCLITTSCKTENKNLTKETENFIVNDFYREVLNRKIFQNEIFKLEREMISIRIEYEESKADFEIFSNLENDIRLLSNWLDIEREGFYKSKFLNEESYLEFNNTLLNFNKACKIHLQKDSIVPYIVEITNLNNIKEEKNIYTFNLNRGILISKIYTQGYLCLNNIVNKTRLKFKNYTPPIPQ